MDLIPARPLVRTEVARTFDEGYRYEMTGTDVVGAVPLHSRGPDPRDRFAGPRGWTCLRRNTRRFHDVLRHSMQAHQLKKRSMLRRLAVADVSQPAPESTTHFVG